VYQQPYEVTVRAFLALEDVERIEQLVAEGRRIDHAYLMNAAFADGKRLQDRNRAFKASLQYAPYEPRTGGLTTRQREVLTGIFSTLARVQRPPEPVS